MKVIGGYKDGTDIFIAMERGELDGRCGGLVTVIKATRPDWFTARKVNVPVVISDKRSAEFPDSPTVMEFVKDEKTRRTLELVMLAQTLDRPMMAPPGVPEARVRELRAALEATVKDPAFLAMAAQRNLSIDLTDGATMTHTLERAFATPPDVIEAAREAMGGRYRVASRCVVGCLGRAVMGCRPGAFTTAACEAPYRRSGRVACRLWNEAFLTMLMHS
jgi:tripartite-type tricarboxylate transporter receptor subunit TctC